MGLHLNGTSGGVESSRAGRRRRKEGETRLTPPPGRTSRRDWRGRRRIRVPARCARPGTCGADERSSWITRRRRKRKLVGLGMDGGCRLLLGLVADGVDAHGRRLVAVAWHLSRRADDRRDGRACLFQLV
jgi:hypothetical protein